MLNRSTQSNRTQLVNALSFLLPESPYFQVLSSLPPPDHTAPESTTTFRIQDAVHNTLAVLEEIIGLVERQEEDYTKKEFEKRRTRLNAGPPDEIRQTIGREIWGSSKVGSTGCFRLSIIKFFLAPCTIPRSLEPSQYLRRTSEENRRKAPQIQIATPLFLPQNWIGRAQE